MAVVTGAYSNNELQVYKYITSTMRLNNAAACGIMANIYHESRFDHLASGDGDTSFGLCQWHASRKKSLQTYCSKINMNYRTVSGQMSFLYNELQNSYKSVLNTLKGVPDTPAGAYEAAHKFCVSFERPANASSKAVERGNLASTSYWNEYSDGANLPAGTSYTKDYGSEIVRIARQNIGKPYKSGSSGPDSFDAAGFIHYCYNQAGYPIEKMSVSQYYSTYASKAKSVTPSEVSAGDLVFYSSTVYGVYHVGIATGEGGSVYVSTAEDEVIENSSSIGNTSHILRIVADSETSQSYSSLGGYENAVEDFTALTVRDDHAVTIGNNLSRVEAVGFDYGYLIDLTHGGEFKFYIPEFTESAGASWEDINIIGRSVSIKAYSHTNSRTISIALDLYAGAGLYNDSNHEDIVGKLHQDVNFIKSLEYPDYTNPIVRPPATVQLILGSSINLVGVVSDVNVEHLKPLDSQNRSMYIKVSFSVSQIAPNPPDYTDIKEGRYVLTSTDNISSLTTSDNKTNAPNFTG